MWPIVASASAIDMTGTVTRQYFTHESVLCEGVKFNGQIEKYGDRYHSVLLQELTICQFFDCQITGRVVMLLKLVGTIELGLLFSASEFDKSNVRRRKVAQSPPSRCRDCRWNRIWKSQAVTANRYLASIGWAMVAREKLKEHNADLRDFCAVSLNRPRSFSFAISSTFNFIYSLALEYFPLSYPYFLIPRVLLQALLYHGRVVKAINSLVLVLCCD